MKMPSLISNGSLSPSPVRFIAGSWKNAPFSHFQLKRSHQNAEEMFGFFDQYRVGFDAATVEFDGDTAILKVRTMMGADTIEQIEAARNTRLFH